MNRAAYTLGDVCATHCCQEEDLPSFDELLEDTDDVQSV